MEAIKIEKPVNTISNIGDDITTDTPVYCDNCKGLKRGTVSGHDPLICRCNDILDVADILSICGVKIYQDAIGKEISEKYIIRKRINN